MSVSMTRKAARTGLLLSVAASSLALSLPAFGQADEIIVTAQKREQNIQDVPIAVSAFGAETLEAAGVSDIKEVVSLAPSLVVTSSASEASGTVARIRGIGTTGDNIGLESAVGTFVDGVYRNRNNTALTELGDIERIEVLRGPQGTLFGRNTSAGLINIISKAPSLDTFSGRAEGSYGNYDYWQIKGGVNGPIVNGKLGGKIDGVYEQRDGFLEDRNSGREFNDRDRYLVRGQLLYQPTEDFSLRFIADYADRDENCCAATASRNAGAVRALGVLAAITPPGLVPFVNPPDISEEDATVTPNRGYQQDVEDWGVSGEINWDLGFADLVSITAYRDWEAARSQDIDFTGADLGYRGENGFVTGFETFTQELRLQGNYDRLDWLVGFFYSNEDLSSADAIRSGNQLSAYLSALAMAAVAYPADVGNNDVVEQNAESYALFTHNSFRVTDALSLTAGLRFTSETKEFSANYSTVGALPCANPLFAPALGALGALACTSVFNPFFNGIYNGEQTEEEFSGTLNASYRFSDTFLAYLSYGRGYKGGGFNTDRAGLGSTLSGPPTAFGVQNDVRLLQFDPEFVDAYELGWKSQFFGNALILNGALFYMDFEDFQLNTFNGLNFVVRNLPTVTSKGIELEFLARPEADLSIQGGLTYAQTEYGDDVEASVPATQRAAFSRLDNNTITNAPNWVITLGATYTPPIPNTTLNGLFHVDARYTSSLNTGSDLNPFKEQNGYMIVNGRVGIGGQDNGWAIELWARNLLDKDYNQIIFDSVFQSGNLDTFLGEPRTFGITGKVNF